MKALNYNKVVLSHESRKPSIFPVVALFRVAVLLRVYWHLVNEKKRFFAPPCAPRGLLTLIFREPASAAEKTGALLPGSNSREGRGRRTLALSSVCCPLLQRRFFFRFCARLSDRCAHLSARARLCRWKSIEQESRTFLPLYSDQHVSIRARDIATIWPFRVSCWMMKCKRLLRPSRARQFWVGLAKIKLLTRRGHRNNKNAFSSDTEEKSMFKFEFKVKKGQQFLAPDEIMFDKVFF